MVWLHGGLEIMGYVLGHYVVIMGDRYCALTLARSLCFVPLCSAPCGPIRLKFYVLDGLGYGHKGFEFRWDASRYVSAAVEKPSKTDDFRRFWPGLTDAAADCSAPWGPIWLKFYVVDGLGYGYG